MTKKTKGRYSKTPRKTQLANKRARDRRYRAHMRQRTAESGRKPPELELSHDPGVSEGPVVETRDRPADMVDANAEEEHEPSAEDDPANADASEVVRGGNRLVDRVDTTADQGNDLREVHPDRAVETH